MMFELCEEGGFFGWQHSDEDVEIRFFGKGPSLPREAALRRVLPDGVQPAWLDQVHSARVVEANRGVNGPGDALVTGRARLALSVVTADCVPVLLADENHISAVHAGWRGLVGKILANAISDLGYASRTVAWIGPAIGPCCYEVGQEVADQVVSVSSPDIVHEGKRGRPHLDLVAAARQQLMSCGVQDVRAVGGCTRCNSERLWSYRRDGSQAGRNYALIWRSAEDDLSRTNC